MEIEAEPNAAVENIKWNNRRDEAYGLLCLSISRDLLFHLDGFPSPDEVWEKIETLFGKNDEMRGHQLENKLISLIPSTFKSLQVYFSKFMGHRPGELGRASSRLGDAGININYGYCGTEPNTNATFLIFGVAEVGKALKILEQAAAAAATT